MAFTSQLLFAEMTDADLLGQRVANERRTGKIGSTKTSPIDNI